MILTHRTYSVVCVFAGFLFIELSMLFIYCNGIVLCVSQGERGFVARSRDVENQAPETTADRQQGYSYEIYCSGLLESKR